MIAGAIALCVYAVLAIAGAYYIFKEILFSD